jgi:beta-glucosidase
VSSSDARADRRAEGETKAMTRTLRIALAASAAVMIPSAISAQMQPWQNRSLSPDERAAMIVRQMTQDEKLTLVFGYFASDWQGTKPPAGGRYGSAG